MNNWEILGIEPTDDIEIVKNAYAQKSKLYHPETHPDEFQRLYKAYKALTRQLHGYSSHIIFPEEPENIIIPTHTVSEPQDMTDDSFADDMAFLERIDAAAKEYQDSILKKYGLNTLDNLLCNHTGFAEWRDYFTSDNFLCNQYNSEYIRLSSARFEEAVKKNIDKYGNCDGFPAYAFIYIVIAYGCIFPQLLTDLNASENIYKSNMLDSYNNALLLYNYRMRSYTRLEKDPVFLSERFAFYVYRNILAILDAPYINRDTLSQWIAWGLAEEHSARMSDIYHYAPTHGVRISTSQTRLTEKIFRSDVIFKLLTYLLTNASTPPVYRDVLKSVCETFMINPGCCEEIKELHSIICG